MYISFYLYLYVHKLTSLIIQWAHAAYLISCPTVTFDYDMLTYLCRCMEVFLRL